MRHKLFASFLFLLAGLLAWNPAEGASRAVNYSFSHIDPSDGLSSSCVKTILQDSYGFMWFGTKNGLNRYDGHSIRRYNCYDAVQGRGNNNIGALYEDKDHRLWVGTDRGIYIYDPVRETFEYLGLTSKDGHAPSDWVQDIICDGDGNVWMLVPNCGVFCKRGDELFHYNVTDVEGDKNYIPVTLAATRNGDIYAGTSLLGLYRFDPASDRFVRLGNNGRGYAELQGKALLYIREGVDGNLMLCTQYGDLFHFDTGSCALTPLKFSGTGKTFVRAMMNVDNEVWIGSHKGLYILNLINGSERFLTEAPDDVTGLSNNTVYYIYNDREGNVWVGTMFGGVDYFQRNGFRFERYVHNASGSSLSSNRIRGVVCDRRGHIFIGTEDAGFNIFNPATGLVDRHNNGRIATTMKTYGGKVFVGYSRNGMDVVDESHKVVNALSARMNDDVLNDDSNSVYSYLVDNRGNRWVGSDWGLFMAEAGSNDFKPVEQLKQAWIFDIFQDSKGLIWIASMGSGIWKYNPSANTFRHYPFDDSYSNGLRTNSISSVMEASDGTIWFSSDRGGLVKYEPNGDRFVTYSIEEGLPDNVVYNILEDRHGYLWFGTNSGLVKFDPRNGKSRVFTTAEGLLGNQFNYHSAAKGEDGYFYFGSLSGLVAFNPDLETQADSISPVYFTKLLVGSSEVMVGDEDSPLDKGIMFSDCLELSHDFGGMTIGVASPSYSARGATYYSYRLLPSDTTWYPISDREITFNQLPPGRYTLEVRADNGIASSVRSLPIVINGPWYNTWWAMVIYVLLLIGAVVGWGLWYRRNKERQLREEEKLYKMSKEKELYENKVLFFTDLAHEIRTPLSLIDAPLQAIEEECVTDKGVLRYVKVMRQNTTRLLNLTGQLLDFQKIGASKFNITYENVDVTTTVSETLDRFEPAMCVKGKELVREIPDKSIFAVVDREALTKILSNMFNNALKYSDHLIKVELTTDESNFTVRVTSDGEKISDENRYRIFEPFFQIDSKADNNGVGIGLPLCRTLAHLQKGSIDVENNEEVTNTFVLTLPLRHEEVEVVTPDVADESKNEYIMNDEDTRSNTITGYTLLVVEDNEQMRDFLCDQLSEHFIVESCANGEEALAKIKEHNYDLIVTDIMMPRMDGFELCTAIKEDLNRSHIPVVFLTAKNDLESKLKALKCGGEAYIEKPFSIKYFRQQVLSLLENRRHERKAFLKQPFFTIDNMKMTEADKEFMGKVIKSISENIAEENFSVESMAGDFCMSRSSLLRKIKTLFNLSPVELIRTIKLKKAAELLQEGKYRIGDVCFMVGINSPSYFSKLFFKQFGVSPKEFEKQCRKNSQASIAREDDVIAAASKK